MRRALVLLALLVTAACNERQHSRFDGTATADLAHLTKGECTAVTAHFDATMTSGLSATKLCDAYLAYVREFGDLRGQDAAYTVQRGQISVVRIVLHLATADGEFRESFHKDGSVAGLYLLKAGVPL